MLFPKKVKHRKWHTARRNPNRVGVESRGTEVSFGSHGLKAVSAARVTSNQIEAARKVLARNMGKTGRAWIRIFPDRPFTQKGAEVPMGKGKGDVKGFVAAVRPGRVLFEVDGVADVTAREALRQAGMKLPLKVRVIARQG